MIVSGNVELNPGPYKKCLKCETLVPNRTMACVCGYVFRKRKQSCDTDVIIEKKRMSMKIKRVCESKAETELRNETNKLSMKNVRMCETENEALCRNQIDKLSKKRVRMCETEDEALCRKQINKLSMKKYECVKLEMKHCVENK